MSTVSRSTFPKRFHEWTKLRYRWLFFIAMLVLSYYLPLYADDMGISAFKPKQDVVRATFVILAVWTAWASVYKYASPKDAFNSPVLKITLARCGIAMCFLLFAMGFSISTGL